MKVFQIERMEQLVIDRFKATVGENIIATIKMQKKFYPLKMVIFLMLR